MANRYQGKRQTTVIRLPVDMYEQLAREAQEKGISLNAYMVRLIILGRSGQSGRDVLRTVEQSI